ncbi:hypothetical protein H6P81_005251 [Aristolochia fimbriata]|uniref:HMA domain-containing protein n=1 Tax=Aristolochia fimbriata TaxID=158543 RepID=A0AAV7EU16_ARIFI|nr:hypothetical protein H6P81_005251 [Aristolochia fimbriata]
MEKVTHQALSNKENLSLPSVQVIVMNANMGCSHCRQRVSLMISKINGVIDCVVDVKKREVTVRGLMNISRRSSLQLPQHSRAVKQTKKSFCCFPALFGANY